ncbi:MAG: ankyrin repeat domain-containing protein [Oligoflexia bacterium]|nr:ankyrin repeat domain-containing protein [Oligoflexia bacterium]
MLITVKQSFCFLLFALLFFSFSAFSEECPSTLYQEFKRTDCKEIASENYQVELSSDKFKISLLDQGSLGVCYSCTIKTLMEHYLKKEKVISAEEEVDLNDIISKNNDGYFIEGGHAQIALEQLKKYGKIALKGEDYYPYEQVCASLKKSPLKAYLNELLKLKLEFTGVEAAKKNCEQQVKKIAKEINVPEDFLHLPEMISAINQTKILYPLTKESIKGITAYKNPTSKMIAECLLRKEKKNATKKIVDIPPFNTILNCYNSNTSNSVIQEKLLSQLSQGIPMGISVSGHEIVLHGYRKMLCKDISGKDKTVELFDIRNSWGKSCTGTYLAEPFYNILKEVNCSVSIEKCIPGKTCLSYIKINQSWTVLNALASLGDIKGYLKYISEQSTYDKSDFTFGTMLSKAVKNNQLPMVSELIEKGVQGRVKATAFRGVNGMTQLLNAVKNNYFDILKKLLYSPILAESYNNNQLDILYSIATEDNKKLQQEFASDKDNFICKMELADGTTALMLAVASDNPITLKIVLEHCDPNTVGVNATDKVPAIIFAARNGQLKMLKQLMSHSKINPLLKDNAGNTLLLAALENVSNDNSIIDYVLSIPTVVEAQINKKNNQGSTPLLKASTMINKNIITSLIKSGAKNIEDVNSHADTSLHLASKKGNVAIIRELLKIPGANKIFLEAKNSDGKTPLQLAVEAHKQNINFTLAKEFLTDPNMFIAKSAESEEASLLFWSVEKNDLTSVEMLLSIYKIDPNIGTKSGITPLMLAIKRENFPMVKTLIEKAVNKLDFSKTDNDGNNISKLLKQVTNLHILKYLKQNGVR